MTPGSAARSRTHWRSAASVPRPSDTNWNTDGPASEMPWPMAMSSSGMALVPGMNPCLDECRMVRLVEKPMAPSRIASAVTSAIWLELVGRDLVGVGVLAEHVGAQRGVGHLGGDVDGAGHLLERVEVLAEGLPPPVDALVERGAGDVLDRLHELDEEVLLAGPQRGEADAAVAHDDRGRAVPRRRRHLGVPGDLAVVVGVDVDPAGGDEIAAGVDLVAAVVGDPTVDGRPTAVIRPSSMAMSPCEAVGAGAVDDEAVADDDVVHVLPPGVKCQTSHRRTWKRLLPARARAGQ